MKTKKKILMALAIACCAILLVVGSIAGTVAYLTSTDTVTNTFTVGNVAITLDEAKVDVYGVVDGTDRVEKNTYKLIPGHSYTKDPVIHVQAGSEKSYLFVKITDEIAAIQDTETIADQLDANGWILLDGDVWYLDHAVDASDSANDIDVKVFESIKIKSDAAVATYEGKTIEVVAYAVQADGFDTAAKAWNATFGA